jgi:hypothetical protein
MFNLLSLTHNPDSSYDRILLDIRLANLAPRTIGCNCRLHSSEIAYYYSRRFRVVDIDPYIVKIDLDIPMHRA